MAPIRKIKVDDSKEVNFLFFLYNTLYFIKVVDFFLILVVFLKKFKIYQNL